jgi:osmotically-inducible protein OsmY
MRKNTERKVMNDVNIYSIPKVVVIGVKNKINNKIDLDESFNVDFVFSDFNNVKQVIDHNSVAILVDENEIKSDIDLYLEKLLKNYQYLPIFYLAREKKRANFFKKLYEKGLHGVINWPDEAPILQQLLVESLKPHPKAIGESKGDRRLSDLVKSHINLFGNYHGIKVKVIDGFAFLEGVVKSLYDKRKMGDEVESVLGIKSAIIDNLKIRKFKNVTDQELERRIKMFIGHILAEEKRSMTVKVRDRVVYIKGSSKRQSDLLDIQEFAMKQQGVMSVKTDVKL